jgi:hypothetical protein
MLSDEAPFLWVERTRLGEDCIRQPDWYALVPGQSVDSFAGGGWTLTGGAKILSTTLDGGKTGYALDLPSGARAVSPAMCVDSNWPTARTMMRNVAGSAGVSVSVAYLNDGPFSKPLTIATVTASGTTWAAPAAMNIHSKILTGPQQAQFTLTGTGSGSEYQLYNFYVDPRML